MDKGSEDANNRQILPWSIELEGLRYSGQGGPGLILVHQQV